MLAYETLDGIISIAGGAYGYLMATGKVKVGKTEEQSIAWKNKYGKMLKVVGPFLILFGIFRLSQSFLGIS